MESIPAQPHTTASRPLDPQRRLVARPALIMSGVLITLGLISAFLLYNLIRLINPPIDWSVLPSPAPATQGCPTWRIMKGIHADGFITDYKVMLSRVEAFSNNNVWALGTVSRRVNKPDDGGPSFGDYPDLVLRYNGHSWSRMDLSSLEKIQPPDIAGGSFSVSDIRPVSPNEVWLLGTYRAATDCSHLDVGCNWGDRHFQWRWNGRNWERKMSAPSNLPATAPGSKHVKPDSLQPSLPDAQLYGDAVVLGNGSIWAVGGFDAGMGMKQGYALVAQYTSKPGCP